MFFPVPGEVCLKKGNFYRKTFEWSTGLLNFRKILLIFQYTTAAMRKDLNELEILIKEISSCDEGQFSKTEDIRNCRLCEYRSYCERGEKAGDWDDESDLLTKSEDLFESLDFDQIGEIAF